MGRKWAAFVLIEFDGVIHEFAEFGEDDSFVRVVTATVEEARTTTDVASVYFGPFDDFGVTCGRSSLRGGATLWIRLLTLRVRD